MLEISIFIVFQTRALLPFWHRDVYVESTGTPLNMTFVPKSNDFELCYLLNTSISQPTEIYASFSRHYPNGVNTVFSSRNVVITSQVDTSYS
jgi:hypothetical protein